MRAAIYARRSTEEHQAASLDVQTDEARRFCAARGWTVDERHVYTDSGVSRAEFVNRPALVALLLAAERKEVDAVVTRDESRLGGDQFRVGLLIQDLTDAGAQLWYYYAAERIEANDATAKFMIAVRGFAAELEREKLAGRTREHLERKARAGYVVGGRVYGYDNVDVREGEQRTRVEYAINAREAAVVREVFQRYAAGEGLRPIAADLNRRTIPSPHAGRRGTGSWGPTTLHDLLRRERYRGVLVWGWRGSAYRKGTRVEIRRPQEQWTRAERPDLAIVDEAMWAAAQARVIEAKRDPQSARRGPKPRHLLAGLARCAACGGPMQGGKSKFGSARVLTYACGWALDRGATVCTVRVMRPAAELEGALIDWIRANVLRPEVVQATLIEARRLLEDRATKSASAEGTAEVEALETELRRVTAEIARITTAIATTDAAPEALIRALADRETRARGLRAELATARAPAVAETVPWEQIEQEARMRIEELGTMLGRNVGEGRAVLKALLRGPIQCALVKAARGHRYRLSGELVVPGLEPLVVTGGPFASPTGFEQTPGYLSLPFSLVAGAKRAA